MRRSSSRQQRPRWRHYGWCIAALVACDASEAADTQICAEAAAQTELCLGVEPPPPSPTCEGADREAAQAILDELERSGCEGPPEKDDSFLCERLRWDPLGWCKTPPPPLGPEPQGKPTRYPIILAHGFNTSTTNFWRFNDVDTALIADGHDVVLGSVPPFDTAEVRAGFLADQVDALLQDTGAAKVNLVCFSMGGLDCRYLASAAGLDYGDKIASITTVSTPHRGTRVADVGAGLLPDADRSGAIDALASLWGMTFSELAADSHFVAAIEQISERNMVSFNEDIGDHSGVFYQSWAGISSVGGLPHPKANAERDACRNEKGQVLLLRHDGTHDVLDPLFLAIVPFVAHGTKLLPNDGLSTVASSKWGLFRGCIPADHLDQAGQINDGGPDRHTGFDFIRFYRNLAFDLAARGY